MGESQKKRIKTIKSLAIPHLDNSAGKYLKISFQMVIWMTLMTGREASFMVHTTFFHVGSGHPVTKGWPAWMGWISKQLHIYIMVPKKINKTDVGNHFLPIGFHVSNFSFEGCHTLNSNQISVHFCYFCWKIFTINKIILVGHGVWSISFWDLYIPPSREKWFNINHVAIVIYREPW